MRPLRFVLVAAILVSPLDVCSQQIASSQTAPVPQRDPQAIAIINQALSAIDPQAARLTVADTYTSGTVRILQANPPATRQVVIKSKGLQMTRSELAGPDGTTIRIVNQGRGAIQTPDGNIRWLIGNNLLSERVSHLPSLSFLAEWQGATVSCSYLGTASVQGLPVDIVSLSSSGSVDPAQAAVENRLSRTLFYVDQATKLPVKVEHTAWAENHPGNSMKEELLLTDYRIVGTTWIPFKQVRQINGVAVTEFNITSVSFNRGALDSDFVLPSATAK